MTACARHTTIVIGVALGELEKYTQARIGNIQAPELTGKFAAATFEHNNARPVDGYARRNSTCTPSFSMLSSVKTRCTGNEGISRCLSLSTQISSTPFRERLSELALQRTPPFVKLA